MSIVYVDTSVVIAIVLGETQGVRARSRLKKFQRLCSASLLEAEFRSVMKREQLNVDVTEILDVIDWIHPNRRLTREIDLALTHGYLRGADLWHIASALFFASSPAELPFATLDKPQRDVASALGFPAVF